VRHIAHHLGHGLRLSAKKETLIIVEHSLRMKLVTYLTNGADSGIWKIGGPRVGALVGDAGKNHSDV
jgi:hypothetical protein